jgi:predicted transcriptional regulator
MSGWRQAVFVRQRRCDVIQRALSKILDEESWSPATPRRLRIGTADASSRGWTMVIPELANFFLDRGGLHEPRLCRLARELHCPAYEVDVRDASATTLFEIDERGRLRVTGSTLAFAGVAAVAGALGDGAAELIGFELASPIVSFESLALPDDIRERLAELGRDRSTALARGLALADYLGAIAGFPAWTRFGDDAVAAGELVYEPPRIVTREHGRAHATGELKVLPLGTREAIARTTPRDVLSSHDRRGRRPRSVSRPRR